MSFTDCPPCCSNLSLRTSPGRNRGLPELREETGESFSSLGACNPPTGSPLAGKPPLFQLFWHKAQGRAPRTPGLIHLKRTKLGNSPACPRSGRPCVLPLALGQGRACGLQGQGSRSQGFQVTLAHHFASRCHGSLPRLGSTQGQRQQI